MHEHKKMQQACSKNNFTLEEIKLYTNAHFSGYFSLME